METIVVHYGEIGIKGKNRPWFERMLVENMRAQLSWLKDVEIKRIFGRIMMTIPSLSAEEKEKMIAVLGKVFGIASFSFALSVPLDMESIKSAASSLMEPREEKSFRVLTKRSNKQFPLSSPDVNKEVGQHVAKKFGKVVDYVDADMNIHIEIVDKQCFVYTEKREGLRGLPVGVSGKVVVLISGGIDSPVAAWYAMKRGCAGKFFHFFN